MDHPDTPQTKLQRQCRLFGALCVAAVALSLAGVIAQVATVAAPLWKGGPAEAALINTAKQAALSVPALLYIASLYFAGRVFRRIARGEYFARANAAGLLAMGQCLLIGGLWAMAVEGLVPYSPDQPLAQTMNEVGRASADPFLAALGLALILLGKVLGKAAILKARHDEFV